MTTDDRCDNRWRWSRSASTRSRDGGGGGDSRGDGSPGVRSPGVGDTAVTERPAPSGGSTRLLDVASLENPAGVLAELLSRDPSRPLYTFYDDATGERVELSVKSFENWVAKTANLLQDGLGTEPGDRIAVMLPT